MTVFTLKMKSQSIAYLLHENERTYWILNLGNAVHSIWVIWTNGPQECKDNFIFSKRNEVDMEHGLHPDSEGGVHGTRPSPGQR